MTRARRIITLLGMGVGVLLALAVLLAAFVLFTTPGAKLALTLANRRDLPVRARAIEGTLWRRFELRGVELHIAPLGASIDTVIVAWRPLLLRKRRVDLTEVTIASARVVVQPAPPDSAQVAPPSPHAPAVDSNPTRWVVTADRVRVRNATVEAPGGVRLDDVGIVASGGPDGYRAAVVASGSAWRVSELEVFMRATGNTEAATIDSLDVRTMGGIVSGNAFMRWSPGLSWRGRLHGEDIHPGELFAKPDEWLGAVAFRVQGTGVLREDSTRIGVDVESLQGVLRDRPLSAGGRVDIAGARIRSSSAWVRWGSAHATLAGSMEEVADITLDATVPSLAEILPRATGSAQVRGRLTGSSSRIDLDVTASGKDVRVERWAVPDFDGLVNATLSARDYVPDAAELRRAEIRVGEGTLDTRGRVSWRDGLTWDVTLSADEFETSTLAPASWNLYGPVSVRATTSGSRRRTQLKGVLSIASLAGMLRGLPMSGAGSVAVAGGEADVSALDLAWGGTRVRADGHVGTTLDLELDVAAPNLALLDSSLHGALALQGSARGARSRPTVVATVRADSLRAREYAVDHLEANVDADLALAAPADVRVLALGVARGETRFDSVSVLVAGPLDALRASVAVARDDKRAALTVAGAYADSTWSGWIEQVRFRHAVTGEWHSRGRAPVFLSRSRAWIDSLTLASGRARLAARASWQRGDSASVEVVAGPGEIERSGKTIGYHGRVTGRADANGVLARVDFDLNRDGTSLAKVDGRVAMPGYVPGRDSLATQPLDGRIDIDCGDVGPVLAVFAPRLANSSGVLAAHVSPKGTVGDFGFAGRVALEKARFDFPSGFHLRDANLVLESDGEGRVTMEGAATSGGGKVRVEASSARSRKGWLQGTVTAKGERFRLINQPDAQVFVSPDVKVRLAERHATVSGDIRVPFARIELAQVPESAASPSSDVVIVEDTLTTKPTVTVETKVRVALGDSVTFSGFGLRARLAGSLEVDDERGRPTRATGEIQIVEGKYRAFGNELTIDPGRLVFGGGAIDNPGIDVRAYRGLTQQKVTVGSGEIVGVNLRGTLRRPELSVFSNPPMSESEIMSYLVFGRPMSSGSGDQTAAASAALLVGLQQGTQIAGDIGQRFALDEAYLESGSQAKEASFVAGKYLSPKLYVSYAAGLFEKTNTFRVRYSLSSRWTVQAESGDASSTDLLYWFERGK